MDWFRSTDWNDAAEHDFRRRLSRARPHNQFQYRRIKGAALLETGDAAKAAGGRRLLGEIVASPDAPAFEKVMALSMLGEAALRDGRMDEAETSLRHALRVAEFGASGTSGLEEAWLAEVLLHRGGRDNLEEARALVERRAADPPLILSARFHLCLTAAKVADALDDRSAAASWARKALELASAEHSGLANHPRLGLVQMSSETRQWLASLTASGQ